MLGALFAAVGHQIFGKYSYAEKYEVNPDEANTTKEMNLSNL